MIKNSSKIFIVLSIISIISFFCFSTFCYADYSNYNTGYDIFQGVFANCYYLLINPAIIDFAANPARSPFPAECVCIKKGHDNNEAVSQKGMGRDKPVTAEKERRSDKEPQFSGDGDHGGGKG